MELAEQHSADSLTWLRRYSKFVVVAVACLILKGALVTSHNAGLAVPDWPTTFGQNMFLYPFSEWTGGVFWEHGHRILASLIGGLTVILAAWLQLAPVSSPLKKLGLFALFLVIVQGVLGGLTVILRLPDWISVSHGMVGQTFLLVTIAIAYALSKERQLISPTHGDPWAELSTKDENSKRLFFLAVFAVAVLYIQLFFGAVTRHAEAGLAILDFPLMAGQLLPTFDAAMVAGANILREAKNLPPVTFYQVAFHALHRVWAVVVSVVTLMLASQALALGNTCYLYARTGILLVFLVLLQVVLGIAVVVGLRDPWVTSFHVLCGALLLALTFLLSLRAASSSGLFNKITDDE